MTKDISRLLLAINDFKQIQHCANNIFQIAEQKFSNRIEFSDELTEDLRVTVKAVRKMIRTTQEALVNPDMELVEQITQHKENVDALIFETRNQHIQHIQNGNLPMEYDYMILNLFTDLSRTAEHCINIRNMILKKVKK